MRRALRPAMPALRAAYGVTEAELDDMPWASVEWYLRALRAGDVDG